MARGGRIAGITIELNGDATKLTKALADVDRSARQSQNNLKDINKLLKLDPGNTELLQQKFTNLTTSIDSTKQRLETLKEAAAQMKLTGKDNGPEWDALQREIAETEQKLKGLNAEMDKFGSVGAQKIAAAGEQVQQVGEKIEGAGKAIMPTSAAVIGVGAAAVSAASSFEAGMSKVQSLSGATGKEMEDLEAKALEMGNKTKYSATDAADAYSYMAMAGWKSGQMIDGISGIMNLAAASGEDLASTSDIVTDALTAFGLKAGDSAHFADVLAAAATGANTDVGMMGETFKYAAPVAGALGYTVEDTALAIGLMANAGIKSSQAGTSLRRILGELQGEIKITGKELGTTTIQTTNADGSMRSFNDILMDCRSAFSQLSEAEQVATAKAMVGQNAYAGFLAIMNASDEDVKAFSSSLDTCSEAWVRAKDGAIMPMSEALEKGVEWVKEYQGAAEAMADSMNDNLEGQLTLLKGQLETLGISFGKIIIPYIREFVTALQGVVSWLNNLDPVAKRIIVTVGAIIAAAGPVLIFIGKVTQGVGALMKLAPTIVSAISKVHGLIGKLGPAISSVVGVVKTGFSTIMGLITAHPVIAAITAVVAGLVLLYNKCEWFRDAVNGAIQAVIGFFQRLPETWENIKAAAGTIFTAISTFFSTTWENIRLNIETAMTNIQTAITTAWEAIKAFFSPVLSAIGSAVSSAWNSIKSNVTTAMSNIKSNVTTAWNNIKSTITTVLSNIGSAITNGFNTAKNNAANALNAIKDKIKSVWEGAVSLVRGAVDKLKSLMHFSWELPKLKLPHLSITGRFSINPPSVPHFSIEWYKKAMENGMILNSPTILPGANGTLRGFGDAGPEAVVGVDSLRGMIGEAVAVAASGLGGDIIIPVYIGQQRLDTLVVKATQRNNYRSGGR